VQYLKSDLNLLEQIAIAQARQSFWAFRQYINPKMIKGWWQKEIAYALQQFYYDLQSDKKPMLVITAPPQHGKSYQVIDFIAWLTGLNPDNKIIYTSFSERLGVRANLRLQRIYDNEIYKKIFPDTKINQKSGNDNDYSRNRELLEYNNKEGFFRNTTVRGSITGECLDLGIVDDPIKGREQAGSLTVRDKTWDWFTDDFFTRFSENAGLLCILTRWHLDDPIGRLLASDIGKEVRLLNYPAMAVKQEKNRNIGDVLFPEHKSLDFIMRRKQSMSTSSFESLYQQNPIIQGGEIIKGEWFKRVDVLPKMLYRKIFGDTAQKTKEHNDFSVFQCWGYGEDKKIYLIDQIRGKWEAPQLKRNCIDFWIKQLAETDIGTLRDLNIEDKASGTGLIQDIKQSALIPVKAIQRNIDKTTRVLDVISYIESGFVVLLDKKPYLSDFISECEAFTGDNTHAHDDQIDPLCDAITTMIVTKDVTITFESF
jgi:predicted phage terminase large subunit-like protein